MKTQYSAKPTNRSSSRDRFSAAGFSRRMARPSLGFTFSSLTANSRIGDLWDQSLLDRLQAPLTRHHD
jgi:hypothetical protein